MNDRSKKYRPRRLFSFDSLKSGRTVDSEGQDRHNAVNSQVDEPFGEGPFGDAGAIGVEVRLNDADYKHTHHSKLSTTAPIVSTSDQASRSSTPESVSSTTSTSRARWDKIRQHVIVSSASIHRGSPQPQLTAQPFSPPPRSTTPKPFRLARLGFRHVVEQAREAVDDASIFATEVRKACWISRYPEQYKPKGERDGFATTMSSTLYLPFMSNASLSGASGLSSGVAKRQDSMASQSTSTSISGLSNQHPIPSVKPLWQLLMTYATPSADGTLWCPILPHETLILSMLQGPFLRSSHQQERVRNEQRLAMESFEIIFKTWFPNSESSFVNYCLWCCSTSMIPPSGLRLRALNAIHGLLGSRNVKLISSPAAFQSLASGLLNILAVSMTNPVYLKDNDATKTVQSCLNLVYSGACTAFDSKALDERYSAAYSEGDDARIFELLILESLAKCVETTRGPTRAWLVQYVCNEKWVSLHKDSDLSPLLLTLHAEKLNSLSRAAAYVISSHETDPGLPDSELQLVLQLLQDRILPEINFIGANKAAKARQSVAKAILYVVTLNRHKHLEQWVTSTIHEWYRSSTDWKSAFESILQDVINVEAWTITLKTLNLLLYLSRDPARQNIVAFSLPLLNQRIVEDPPLYPSKDLSNIFNQLSHQYPPIFYKPLFFCAASSKEFSLINHLCTLTAITKFVPDFWIRDAEMISVALVSNVGKKTDAEQAGAPFKAGQLGQLVILVELISQVQTARHRKEEIPGTESAFLDIVKYLVSLESRLSVLLDARERNFLYPFSFRVLYCILFREIRLLTHSSKPAAWLPKVVTWLIEYYDERMTSSAEHEELEDTLGRLQTLYETAQHGARSSGNQRRSTVLLSPRGAHSDDNEARQEQNTFGLLSERLQILTSAQKSFAAKAMKVLVLMSTLLTTEDSVRLGPIIWERGLDEHAQSALNSASYLAMHCAEKTSQNFLAIIEVNLKSSDHQIRLKALRKISVLCNRRFDIASQPVITNRNYRPLKLARAPLAFVPTDMGSSLYVPDDNFEQDHTALPLELQKLLAEVGWTQDDITEDHRKEWLHTPMLLVPAHHFNRLETLESPFPASSTNTSPSLTPQTSSSEKASNRQLLRRNSSTGGPLYSVKRKAVFVPSLALAFPQIGVLAFEPSIPIASAARAIIFDLMRNDPSLLSRPILDLFSEDNKDVSVSSAMSTLNLFLHVHEVVPPSMAHYIFNHLAGFLKAAARLNDKLDDFARTIPLLADLVSYVSGMSIHEIHRSKLDLYFVPTGSLWFAKPSPNEHMFPTSLVTSDDPFGGIAASLVSVILIRTSQNLLFASMLRKNQQDVQSIRKHMSKLELPTSKGRSDSELRDFLPSEGKDARSIVNSTLQTLSIMLSRSYLLLVAEIFRSMSRHLSNRNELALFIDGLNHILLAHGDDVGIVGQTLIILMLATTKFRRLFMSEGAFMLFMPAILKVYTEAENHTGIRFAIEYAIGRFYAVYQDAFIFQSLDVISRLASGLTIAEERFGRSVFNLFACLRRNSPNSTPDAAGIHNANKGQEREALLVNAVEEKPQTLLTSMKYDKFDNGGRTTFDIPEEYQAARLRITYLIKLFLTIIAYDLSSLRAENFLKLFRIIVPHMFQHSTASRPVVQEGIDALGVILAKPPKVKVSNTEQDDSLLGEKGTEQQTETSKSKSDIRVMRLDYLSLIASFLRAGGIIIQPTVRRIFDMIKVMLKESSEHNDRISNFLSDFVEASLLHENPPSTKETVVYMQELALVIRAHGATLDLTKVFAVLTNLTTIPQYANDGMFTRALSSQVCSATLAACTVAGAGKLVLTLPYRSSLVQLLAQATYLCGTDIATELEKHTPTYDYLAGVILPLVMTLKMGPSSLAVIGGTDSQHGGIVYVWARLLQYTLSACHNNQQLLNSDGSGRKSMDKRRSTESTRTSQTFCAAQIPTFVIAMQVVKVVLVRAGNELSIHLPALWNRMAVFFRSMLEEGSAEFALQHPEPSLPPSPIMSPTATPRTSLQLDPSPRPSTKSYFQDFAIYQRRYLSPRIVDYTMWSLFELLCSYRTPLSLQMRLFIMDKVLDIDRVLKSQRHLFPASPMLTSSGSRPVSVTAFSKPYRRTSASPSPVISPRLSQGKSTAQDSAYLTISDGRKPGYQYQSSSPNSEEPRPGPRIVHLGPAPQSLLQPVVPLGGIGGMSLVTKTVKIKSTSLIRATYRRIRVVQTYMGYRDILPLPYHEGMDVDRDEVVLSSWTKYQALEVIKKEMSELIEEFDEVRQDWREETVVTQPDDYSSDKRIDV
ncbi:hypothetical protein AX15_000390 [Amanita polypyramis BW_CC]|nr:hypothetical protein AX15_000390 [Amanita polypyramis BW_CC]